MKEKSSDESAQDLQVRAAHLAGGRSNVTTFRVDLLKPLANKESTTVVVETVFSHVILPYPREITQV